MVLPSYTTYEVEMLLPDGTTDLVTMTVMEWLQYKHYNNQLNVMNLLVSKLNNG